MQAFEYSRPSLTGERLMSDDDDRVGDRKPPSEPPKRSQFTKRVRLIRRMQFKRSLPKKLELHRTDPLAEIRKRKLLVATSPNVIDLSRYHARVPKRLVATPVAHNSDAPVAIKCTVIRSGDRPGQRHWQIFEFVMVPELGAEIALGYDPDVYIVRSVTHLAVEPGTGQPSVLIRVRAKKRKR
jgi:hypothetical protein